MSIPESIQLCVVMRPNPNRGLSSSIFCLLLFVSLSSVFIVVLCDASSDVVPEDDPIARRSKKTQQKEKTGRRMNLFLFELISFN